MKTKSTSAALLVALIFVLSLFQLFHYQKQKNLKAEVSAVLQARAKKAAHSIDQFLYEKVKKVNEFSTSGIVLEQLNQSNQMFSKFNEIERSREIDHLNARWIATLDERDPFIKSYIENTVAQYLKGVSASNPDEFGEIFVTNRYGTIIATTNKLTTLAHAKKYWWKAAYDDGKGRAFLDDRGFDQSVKGYVVGVVIPIKKKGEIIGIVKANFNVLGGLSKALWSEQVEGDAKVMLVRSEGLIVLEREKKPLSTLVPTEILMNMNQPSTETREVTYINRDDGSKKHCIVAQSPVQITFGSETIGFGGVYRSADHYKGNEGESWLVLIVQDSYN